MPPLNTKLHVAMLQRAHEEGQPTRDGLYGMHWGDPDSYPPLVPIRDHWILPHVRADGTALEIGPGGGRWTRYLLGFQQLYVVEYYPELLEEFRKNFRQPNIAAILNNGTDFPGVPARSIDFVFSFGVFVHLEADVIASYLANLMPIVHADTQIVIHYSDKTKPRARDPGFSDNDPRRMRNLVRRAGFHIVEEDTGSFDSTAIMRFTPARNPLWQRLNFWTSKSRRG